MMALITRRSFVVVVLRLVSFPIVRNIAATIVAPIIDAATAVISLSGLGIFSTLKNAEAKGNNGPAAATRAPYQVDRKVTNRLSDCTPHLRSRAQFFDLVVFDHLDRARTPLEIIPAATLRCHAVMSDFDNMLFIAIYRNPSRWRSPPDNSKFITTKVKMRITFTKSHFQLTVRRPPERNIERRTSEPLSF